MELLIFINELAASVPNDKLLFAVNWNKELLALTIKAELLEVCKKD